MIHFLPKYGPGPDGRWFLLWRLYGTTPDRDQNMLWRCDRWNSDRWLVCGILWLRELPALPGRMLPLRMAPEEHSGSRIHPLLERPEYQSRQRGNGETWPRRRAGQSLRSEKAPAEVRNSCSTTVARHRRSREGKRPGAPGSIPGWCDECFPSPGLRSRSAPAGTP